MGSGAVSLYRGFWYKWCYAACDCLSEDHRWKWIIGCGHRNKYGGYCADMTRTYGVGELSDEAEGIYEVVRRAQETGLQAAKAGLPANEMDKAARTVIEDAGMGEYYKHGLGHGVGLEVHEAPRIGSRSNDVLEADMVFTVEPGVYRSEIGGVRIEDTVVLRSEGLEVLTVHPHELRTLE